MENSSQKGVSEKDGIKQDVANLKGGLIDLSMIHENSRSNEVETAPISQNVVDFDPIVEDNSIREGYAILSGISDYPGTDNDLSYCDDDVNDLYNFVQSELYIPEENVIRLVDSEVTKGGISDAISAVAAVMDENDKLFFSYSGHGSAGASTSEYGWYIQSSHPYSNNMDSYWHYSAPGAVMMRVHFTRIEVEYGYDGVFVGDNDARHEAWDLLTGSYSNVWSYWVPCDDIYVNLYTDYSYTYWGFAVDKVEVLYWVAPYNIIPYDGLEDGLTGSELGTMFDQIPGSSVILLDSCHSGGVGITLQGEDRYVLAASDNDEYSLEDPAYMNGLFTYQFLHGWDLSEDANLDGVLTFQEIFPHVYAETVSRSSSLGYTHHPQEFDGVNGGLSFKPSAEITDLIELGNNDYLLEYALMGLGESELVIQAYDMEHQTVYTLLLDPFYNTSSAEESLVINIEDTANISVITCRLSSEYRGLVDDSSASISYELFSNSTDADMDGLTDLEEFDLFLNPWDNDTDGDGMDDLFEVLSGLDPLLDDSLFDPDGDNLTNIAEFLIGTDLFYHDSDHDGCPDGWEVIFGLNPLNQSDGEMDFDDDGLICELEYEFEGNPFENDTDLDGLTDFQEYFLGTNLNNTDSDNDGISDADEDYDMDGFSNIDEFIYGTDPYYHDTDEDGCPDGWEVGYDLDPFDEMDAYSDSDGDGLSNLLEFQNAGNPIVIDTDADGLTDFQEYLLGSFLDNPDTNSDGVSDDLEDPDFDDLTNFQEFALGTNPLYWDSDKDGCPDGWELDNLLDPLDFLDGLSDSDGDGLVNYLEYQYFGDPTNIDTDEDGLTDYEEYLIGTLLDNLDTDGDSFSDTYEMNFGTDPLDPNSTPFKNRILPGLVIIPTGVVLSILLRRKLKK
jgi:hypothetical protein